jgi:trehalose 6-phosphate synthase
VDERQVVIASNRGPISFVHDDGMVIPRRGVGGLVTALTGALELAGGLWIASAMSETDRQQMAGGRVDVAAEDAKYSLRYLSFEPETYDRYYNAISNRILWFLAHYLWDVAHVPRFDRETHRSWQAYREVNAAFADALAEEGATLPIKPAYLVQDYHLSLVPAMLRERQPDALIAHFSHVPFPGPSYMRILPTSMREELLGGLLGADVLGFQAEPWADNFLLSCRALPDTRVDLHHRRVRWRDREIRVRVFPISIDVEYLEGLDRTDEAARARRRVAKLRGDAKLILRVDRTDLSKNILRGFLAYEEFLLRHPEWRRRVRFLALLTPSRRAIPEYRAYARDCIRLAERINDDLGDEDWQPIELTMKDDISTTVAAYRLYDVLMVNPVFDGMNLVAKEGPALNRRHGVLILSENAGAHSELGRHAVSVNPFDVTETAEALRTALEMDDAERIRRARSLRAAVFRNPLEQWVQDQLADLEAAGDRSRSSG